MTKLERNVEQIIDSIDAASTGNTLKKALVDGFVKFQNNEDAKIPAKLLDGKAPADLMTKTRLTKLFSDGLVFDTLPKKGSKKAVQSGGIKDVFGDLSTTYKEYDRLFKLNNK